MTHNDSGLIVDGRTVLYDKLCICTGCSPALISDHPGVIGLRDSDSVSEMMKRLNTAKKVMIVGNGGISLELLEKVINYS